MQTLSKQTTQFKKSIAKIRKTMLSLHHKMLNECTNNSKKTQTQIKQLKQKLKTTQSKGKAANKKCIQLTSKLKKQPKKAIKLQLQRAKKAKLVTLKEVTKIQNHIKEANQQLKLQSISHNYLQKEERTLKTLEQGWKKTLKTKAKASPKKRKVVKLSAARRKTAKLRRRPLRRAS